MTTGMCFEYIMLSVISHLKKCCMFPPIGVTQKGEIQRQEVEQRLRGAGRSGERGII